MLFIIIVVIVVIALFLLFIYQKGVLKNIQKIDHQRDTLSKAPIGDVIDTTSKINLNGDSFDQFNEYKEKFNNLTKDELPEIKISLANAHNAAKKFSLLKAKALLNDSKLKLKNINNSMDEINNGLKKLQDLSDQHSRSVDDLDNEIKNINKELLSKNYSYGPSSDKLEDVLNSIKEEYKKFIKSVDDGDQYVAEDILTDLNKNIEWLKSVMDEIPQIYSSLSKEFPKQLDEVERGHNTMLQTEYNFIDDNIPSIIEQLTSMIEDGLKMLSELKVDESKQNNYKIEKSIDSMYSMMEQEIVAKRKVKKNMHLVYDYIYHAHRQNHILISELNKLSKNYTLDHDEIKNAKLFAEKIYKIEDIYNNDYQLIIDNKAVYSNIQAHQQDAKKQLSAIEKEQKDINDSVADLNKEEDEARAKIEKFDLQLLNIRRQIDNLNLPGLTDEYMEKYKYSYNEVSKLGSTINQVKISMDDINKKLSNMEKAMEELISDTDNIIKNAVLAERLMQYANRYRNSNEEVDDACIQSKKYFDNFSYEESLKTISKAIDNVDSGAFNRMEKEYYQQHEKENKKD
ncbi:hypothetical protein MOO46_00775 [Apilactobacillus apisilvae]|uniref:Septation ring formation regulator EzrA n=1 Tax=Apilactobacillus apisilvae TaxID=2923364 RepID=A0ABY4PI29_9LACO|nr:septation ring formation regulator EzrA [Apilactobacillus apisilvae]UQS85168.1 hypothetical protein MOO46_00775 [Apilactobacillus apisilvae]